MEDYDLNMLSGNKTTPRSYNFGRKLDGTIATKKDWEEWREEFWFQESMIYSDILVRSAKHFYDKSRSEVLALATPEWADDDAIAKIYAQARKLGMQVDHIVPLRNAKVCGLHWEGNLQIMPKHKNRIKNNKFYLDKMPFG